MKLEKMRKKNKLILILFLIFNIIDIKTVNADEKNYIVAVVDNEPIRPAFGPSGVSIGHIRPY